MTVYPHAGKEKVYIEYEYAYFVLYIFPVREKTHRVPILLNKIEKTLKIN